MEVGFVVSVCCAEAVAAIKTQIAKIKIRGNNRSMMKCSVSLNEHNQLTIIGLAGKLRVIFKGFC
jgi:hypothetical protein